MRRALLTVLLAVCCMCVAGCVAAVPQPSPAPMEEPVQQNSPEVEASPEVPENLSESAPADTKTNTDSEFFFHPPQGTPAEVEIRIYKGQRILELWLDGEAAGRFPVGLGFSPEGDKEREGDGRTPEGEYYVCSRNDKSNFYLSLGVSYPNTEDAEKALESGLIDRETYERIADAEQRRALPDWHTPMGGEICIHGGGSHSDWTWGCIATDNETMDILWEYCAHGTPIYIFE